MTVEDASLLRALLDSAPDVIMHLDLEGRICFVNRAPYSDTTVVGADWRTFVALEQRPTLERHFRRAIDAGEVVGFEVLGPGPDAAGIIYWTRIGPLWRDGQMVGAVLVARDLTEKRQTEAQLAIADRMASLGTLAAGIAHEINNPLSALTSNIELAIEDAQMLEAEVALAAEMLEGLRDAREAAERVRLIVRDLRLFSRAPDDQRSGPVDVHRVLESTLRMAWNQIRHRARLIKDWGKIPPVDAIESRLGQIFLNLIINAAQAIETGDSENNEIRIATSVDADGGVVVTISDTGCGIPLELQARLYTPFVTTKAIGVGTGLGLSICQRLVISLGGRIELQSTVGKGTTFRVVLPPARLDHVPMEPVRREVATRRRGRVLVIDDDPLVAHATRRLLAREHEVVAIADARVALRTVVDGERFDVILCDLMMPQKSGMDFYDDLVRAIPEQAERIVFITGGAFTPAARAFLDRVGNHRVEKPFDGHGLHALINEIMK